MRLAYEPSLAKRLGLCVQYAYGHSKDSAFPLPAGCALIGTTLADFAGATEEFACLLSTSDCLVLAWRGTETMVDWVADATFAQTPGFVGLVHSGFFDIYGSCRAQVQAAMHKAILSPTNVGKKLYVTGHSLGAALASLCALDVQPMASASVVTFGSPRVGDAAFADAYDLAIKDSVRVVNAYDLVPLLPPEEIWDGLNDRWAHYKHTTGWKRLAFLAGGVRDNHSLDNYLANLT